MDRTTDTYLPLKQAQISVNKFNDVGIPHHLGLLKNHKSQIVKSLALGDWDRVKKEEINATRVVKQLKNLMLEIDILRAKIDEAELDKFDELTLVGRQKAKAAITEFLDLQIKRIAKKANNTDDNAQTDDDDQLQMRTLPQIQTEFESTEHQLRSREACLVEYEKLHTEIEEIQDLFFKLNDVVADQGTDVDIVEDNISETQVHVEAAEKQLRQALTYKKAMYPLCGALLGFCVAGPVGMVTFGLKAGSLAAVGCGILGATGGVALKNKEPIGPPTRDEPIEHASTEPEQHPTDQPRLPN